MQLGVGVPGVSTEQFGRVIGRVVGWWPFTRANQLVARAEAGAVIAQSRVGIPSKFLFRTGGDTTVRGYAFESLGVQAGRRRRRRPLLCGGERRGRSTGSTQTWGLAAFVDAGNAIDTLSRLRSRVGYGVGARLRTPIGPFRLDVAYGEEDEEACACTSPWGFRFERGRTTAAAHAPRAAALACGVLAGWSSLRRASLIAAATCSSEARPRSTTSCAAPSPTPKAILTIEGAEGSLLSTVRVARIAWHGDELDVEARDIALAWSPFDLVSRKLIVQGLGAKRLSLDVQEGGASRRGGPAGHARAAARSRRAQHRRRAARLADRRAAAATSPASRSATRAASATHAIRELRFVTDNGTLAGSARDRRAIAPYALSATLAFEGDGEFKGGERGSRGRRRRSSASRVDAKGTLRNASVAVKAGVTPFAPALVTSRRHRRARRRSRAVRAGAARDRADAHAVGAARRRGLRGIAVGAQRGRGRARRRPRAGRPRCARASRGTATTLALSTSTRSSPATAARPAASRCRSTAGRSSSTSRSPTSISRALQSLAHRDAPVGHARRRSRAGPAGRARRPAPGRPRARVRRRDRGPQRHASSDCARKRAAARSPAAAAIAARRPRAFTLSARATRFNPARFVAMPAGAARRHGQRARHADAAVCRRRRCRARHRAAASPGSTLRGNGARRRSTPTTAKDVAVDAALGRGDASRSRRLRHGGRHARVRRRRAAARASCGRSRCATRRSRCRIRSPARCARAARCRATRAARESPSTRTARRSQWGRVGAGGDARRHRLDRARSRPRRTRRVGGASDHTDRRGDGRDGPARRACRRCRRP